jgi:chromosome segregation and condensation protein ScpB
MGNKKGSVSYEVLKVLAKSKKPLLSAEINQEVGRDLNSNVFARLVERGFVVARPINEFVSKPLVYSLPKKYPPSVLLKTYREGKNLQNNTAVDVAMILLKSNKPLSAVEINHGLGVKVPYSVLQKLLNSGKVIRSKQSPEPYKYKIVWSS